MEAFIHTTFIPSCADIEQWAPAEVNEAEMYKPFPKLEAPIDPVTQEQLDRFNGLVKDIAEGKIAVLRAPKSDPQELQEKISRGIKAVIVDSKAKAANDK